MPPSDLSPEYATLGKKTDYKDHYDSEQLFPISREPKRQTIGVSHPLPFYGYDLWNHYEVSWLNEKGKPVVAIAEILYSCDSTHIIESKSMKLYFNSLNNTRFKDIDTVRRTIEEDFGPRLNGSFLKVTLTPIHLYPAETLHPTLSGTLIDTLDIECSTYHATPALLETEEVMVEETLCSDLLKSNCLVTHQPDWCSVQISYYGKKINHESLLRYLVSFRNDNEFHEQCIEKIFMHLQTHCRPQRLTVYGRSTRRGGLNINAIRSTQAIDPNAIRASDYADNKINHLTHLGLAFFRNPLIIPTAARVRVAPKKRKKA